MENEKDWVKAREAMKALGYENIASVSGLARNNNVETIKIKHGHFLYYLPGLIKAKEESNIKYINYQWNQEEFATFNTFLKLPDEPCMVIADAHCPFVDWGLFEQALRTKDEYKTGSLILAGDTLNCSAQSKFYDMFVVPWQDEKRVARKFIKACSKEFDKVYLLTANHEMRYLRMLEAKYLPNVIQEDAGGKLDIWEVALSTLVEKCPNLKISIYPYCDVGELWRVFHPSTARKQPLSLARDLHLIHTKSIVLAHAHLSGWCPAPNPIYTLIDCGIFANPLQFSYKNLKVTAHYQWTESYVVIKNQKGFLFMKGEQRPVVNG